jgi:hypothetical protein
MSFYANIAQPTFVMLLWAAIALGTVAIAWRRQPRTPQLLSAADRDSAGLPSQSARQLHQAGAQATAASTRSAFVTESSPSQALMAPANPWATNCAMT